MHLKLCDSCSQGSSSPLAGAEGTPKPPLAGACASCGALAGNLRLYSLRELLAELVSLREAARRRPWSKRTEG